MGRDASSAKPEALAAPGGSTGPAGPARFPGSGTPAGLDGIPEPFSPYARIPLRRRALIALLAALTAIGIVLLLLYPPGGVQRKRPPAPAEVAPCAAGQTQGCVGSKTQVLVAPAQAASTGQR